MAGQSPETEADRAAPIDLEGEDKLVLFGDLLASLAEVDGVVGGSDAGLSITLERLALELPIEVALEGGEEAGRGGGVSFAVSPPRQRIATTIQPVFHGLRLTVVRSDAGE